MRVAATLTDGMKVWEDWFEVPSDSMDVVDRVVHSNISKFNRSLSTGVYPRKVLGISSNVQYSNKEDVIRAVSRFKSLVMACKTHDHEERVWCRKNMGEINDIYRDIFSESPEKLLYDLKRIRVLIQESHYRDFFKFFLSQDTKYLRKLFKK